MCREAGSPCVTRWAAGSQPSTRQVHKPSQESVPPGRVVWEFWTSSNDGCGNGCDRQAAFKKAMRSDAQDLEQVRGASPGQGF